MPRLNTASISSQQKTVSSSSPKQRGAKFKSDEIIKDSDNEGDVLPSSNGNQVFESKRKHKDPSIGSLTAKASSAISNGALIRKRKRDTPSAAVLDSSDRLSDSPIHIEVAENATSGRGDNSRGSESGSENEDSVEGSDNELSKTKENITKKAKKKLEPAESASRYRPPSGFDPATITIRPNSSFAELFSPARLRNKQIWHIAVPSSVRIDSLTEFSTTSVQTGDTVLSYKGADFGLVLQPKTRTAKKTLLLPSTETNEYRPVEVEIVRNLQLQQLPPKGSNGLGATLNAATSKRRSYKKAPPEQPDGLRMRYHPFGVTDYSSDKSQPENQTQVPKFRRPLGIEISPTQIQNGESIDVEMHDASQQPRSKHKKKRDAVEVERHTKSSESAPPTHHDKKRDSVDRETPGNKHNITSDTSDIEMTQGSPQPLLPPMPDKQSRESVEVEIYDLVSERQSTQKLKREKKRHANSKLEINAPIATNSETDLKFNGTKRKRKKDRYTRSRSSSPASEQVRNHSSTTNEDQDLHPTRPGTIDPANLGSGEEKHKKKLKKKRHAKPDISPAPEEGILR